MSAAFLPSYRTLFIILSILSLNCYAQAQFVLELSGVEVDLNAYGRCAIHDPSDSSIIVATRGRTLNGIPAVPVFKYKNGQVIHLPMDSTIWQYCGYPTSVALFKGDLYLGSWAGMARLHQGQWEILDSAHSAIITMEVIRDTLFIGGLFNDLAYTGLATFAAYDGQNFFAFHGSDQYFNDDNYSGSVTSIIEYKNSIVVGGSFTNSGPGTLDPRRNLMRYDGQQWTGIGGGIQGNGLESVIDLSVKDGHLYVAGAFRKSDGAPGDNIARWDGRQWWDMNSHFISGGIFGMFWDEDTLLMGGQMVKEDIDTLYHLASFYDGDWCYNKFYFDWGLSNFIEYQDTIFCLGNFDFFGDDSSGKQIPMSPMAKIVSKKFTPNKLTANKYIQNLEKLKLYPNPTENTLNLVSVENLGHISVYNILGEKVLSTYSSHSTHSINTSQLAPGVYIVHSQNTKNHVSSIFTKL